ncbi:hypothetical protein [Streptomyces sp. 2231.1]|uniref:hypothetical protein n=1 Tax=Streptomyces sp. 2231.1 TaxID=1855347 RepID=UPI000B82F99B
MTVVVGLFPISLPKRKTAGLVELHHPRHPFTEAAVPPSSAAVSARWPVPDESYLISIRSFLASAIPRIGCPEGCPPMSLNATAAARGAEIAPENVPDLSHQRRWWILLVVSLSMLLGVLDGTIVNIALPSAQRVAAGRPSSRRPRPRALWL